jgi:CRISPR-associated exonuclease Cas4
MRRERRGHKFEVRSLALRSFVLGIAGRADIVELQPADKNFTKPVQHSSTWGQWCAIPEGTWMAIPIEYKRGKPKKNLCDMVQLCAQALCLEEMFSTEVLTGYIYYGESGRRLEISFDSVLRKATVDAGCRLHELFKHRTTPPAKYEKKCNSCSLYQVCMPKLTNVRKGPREYLLQGLTG